MHHPHPVIKPANIRPQATAVFLVSSGQCGDEQNIKISTSDQKYWPPLETAARLDVQDRNSFQTRKHPNAGLKCPWNYETFFRHAGMIRYGGGNLYYRVSR